MGSLRAILLIMVALPNLRGGNKSLPSWPLGTHGNSDALPCCLRTWLYTLFKEISILYHLWTSSRLKTYFGYMCFETLVVHFNLFPSVIIIIVVIDVWVLTQNRPDDILRQCFIPINSFNLYDNSMKEIPLLFPLCIWGNRGLEKWSPKPHR